MPRVPIVANKPPLGALIVTRLNEVGKSQKWLADEVQVTQIYLCAVLAGRANPTIRLLQRISRSLNIDIRDMVDALLSGK